MHSGPIFGAFFSGWTVARILQEVLSQEPCLQRVVVFLHQHDVFFASKSKMLFFSEWNYSGDVNLSFETGN